MKLLRVALRILALVFITGCVYVILRYVAGFTTSQSIVLALLFAWLLNAIRHNAVTPDKKFSPYYVRVNPYWDEILLDFKILSKAEEWDAIRESVNTLPVTEYCMLRSGLFFTVVHQSQDFERMLIYLDNHHAFVSEIDFEEGLEPIRIAPRSEPERGFGKKSDVRFFVKYGGEGYELGIRVPSRWWTGVKGTCPQPMREEEDHLAGQVNLVLAAISYREFDLYWETTNDVLYRARTQQIKEQRQKLGWKTEQHHTEVGTELGIDFPESIEHKYFTVTHGTV